MTLTRLHKTSTCFGIHSDRKVKEISKIRFQNRILTFWIGFLIFIFVASVVVLILLDITHSSKALKKEKTKRYANSDKRVVADYGKPLPRTSETEMRSDVEIVPENLKEKSEHRRADHQYPNHRYDEMEMKGKIYEKMMRDLYAESGWSPKPFRMKETETLNNFKGFPSRRKTGDEKEKGENKFRRKNLRGLGTPMRLKGVFIQPSDDDEETFKDQDNENSNSSYYIGQINGLMQNYSDIAMEEGNWSEMAFKSHGSPFQLKSTLPEISHRHQMSHTRGRNQWRKSESKKNRKKPLTVFLDLYPVPESGKENVNTGDHYEEKFHFKGKPTNEIIYMPWKSKEKLNKMRNGSLNFLTRFFHPREGDSRMTIKLNLYPPNGKAYGKSKRKSHDKDVVYSKHNKEADRRVFGLFSKLKKKKKSHVEECPVIAFGLYGKPVAAKWKNNKGEWIYADHVILKRLKSKEDEWDRRSDSSRKKQTHLV